MTEQAFIDTSDLRTVMYLRDLLKNIEVANQPHIDREKYTDISKTLERWEHDLFSEVRRHIEHGRDFGDSLPA